MCVLCEHASCLSMIDRCLHFALPLQQQPVPVKSVNSRGMLCPCILLHAVSADEPRMVRVTLSG